MVNHAFGVANGDVFALHAQSNQQVQAGDGGRTRAGADEFDLADILAHHAQGVQYGGGGDDGRTVLVVVENGDVAAFAQFFLNIKTLGCFDVFEIDAAEGGFQRCDDFNQFVGIGFIDFDVEYVDVGEFFEASVVSRLNIVVSGGTGSGKTTLLNVLSSFIPEDERIITVEDSAELQLAQRHVVRLETAPPIPGEEEIGKLEIRDLVKGTLRMRPDRLVVGECRSGEALDMLQAMNTGHDGSLTTVHSNSPRDAVARLETLCMMAGMDLPVEVIRSQIAAAIHMFVQQARLKDGSRKVTQITEMQGMEGTRVTLQDIFVYKTEGHRGQGYSHEGGGKLEATGFPPKFLDTFKQYGFNLPSRIFKGGSF